jgi:hypothetical protein
MFTFRDLPSIAQIFIFLHHNIEQLIISKPYLNRSTKLLHKETPDRVLQAGKYKYHAEASRFKKHIIKSFCDTLQIVFHPQNLDAQSQVAKKVGR